jgi:hypothetical protein
VAQVPIAGDRSHALPAKFEPKYLTLPDTKMQYRLCPAIAAYGFAEQTTSTSKANAGNKTVFTDVLLF